MFKTFAVAALVGATQAAEWGNRYTQQNFQVRAPVQKFGVYEPKMLAKTGYRGYRAQVYEPKQKFGVYEPGLKAAVPQYGRPSLDIYAPNQKFGVYEPDFKARVQSYGAPQTEVYEPRQKFGVYEPGLKAGYTNMRTGIHYDKPSAQIGHSRMGPITSINAGRANYDIMRNSALFDVDSRSAFVIGDRADDRNVRLFGDNMIGHRQSQAVVGRSQKIRNDVRFDNRQADVAVIRGQSKIYGRGDSEGSYRQAPRYDAPVQRQVSFGGYDRGYGAPSYGGYQGGYNRGYDGGYGAPSYGGYQGGYDGGYNRGYDGGYGGYGGYGYGGQVDRDHDTTRRDNGGENSGIVGVGGDRNPYDDGEYAAPRDESANEGSFPKQASIQEDDADGDDDDDTRELSDLHHGHNGEGDRDELDGGEKGENHPEIARDAGNVEFGNLAGGDYERDGGYGGYRGGYGGYQGGYGGYQGGYNGGYGGYRGGW